jgi:chromosome segregation ATPase
MTLQHYAIAVTLALFFLGTLFGLVKYIAHQQEKRQDERFDALGKREVERFAALTEALEKLSKELREEAQATLQLERQFMRFQADLPRDYVRRDDFLRSIGTIEAKFDNMALRMERALSRTTEGTP